MQEPAQPTLVAKAKRDYISGLGSISQIAERYQLEPRALGNRASKERWKDERDAKLQLTPLNDFQAELIRWKSRANDVLDEFEKKLSDSVKAVDTKDAYALNQLACAVERFINCTREVGGIPRLAPLPAPKKQEKQINVEAEPIESEATQP